MLRTFRVGKHDLVPADIENVRDPRGLLFMWQEPDPNGHYVISCDPSVGIAEWSRHLQLRNQGECDNCAIQVMRHHLYKDGTVFDEQVAEYAAPIDALDAAPVLNLLGKLYAGASEEGEALVAIEVHPGPGIITQRELVQRYGYSNIPPWVTHESLALKITKDYGWWSTTQTRKVLWMKGMHHLQRKLVGLHSPWLIEEMADCTADSFLSFTARAHGKLKDDRVIALLLGIWYCNQWSLAIEPTERSVVEPASTADYQATDISAAGMMDAWNDKFAQLLEE